MNTNDSVSVECYSGHTYAQEPRAFVFNGVKRVVTAVRRRWREPTGPYFEVVADDARVYVLAYDEALEEWHVSSAGADTSGSNPRR